MTAAGQTGQLAVSILSTKIGRLHWLVREQFVHDWGIDLHVERTLSGVPTGELIAVQVKGGPSFFTKRGPGGWWFSFNERHASYWLHHALPVVVVLVDPETERAYWQEISPGTLQRAKKRYRVLVPEDHQIEQALPQWEAMLEQRVRDHAVLFAASLRRVPPSCATHLEQLHSSNPVRAGHLAQRLIQGGREAAVGGLLAEDDWLAAAGRHGPLAVANFCAEHGLHDLQSRALEIAASVDPSRAARHLAVAAIVQPDRDRAAEFLADARSHDEDEIAVAVAQVVASWSSSTDGPGKDDQVLTPAQRGVEDPLVHALFASEAMRRHDWAAAVAPLRQALEAEPASSARMIELAIALANRSRTPAGSATDLSAAEQIARQAIEQRRGWGGSTRDALEILVRVLGLQTRLDDALRACLPAPEGEAAPAETADPFIAHLAIFTAKRLRRSADTIREIIDRIEPAAARQDALDEFLSESASEEQRRLVLRRAISRPDAALLAGLLVQRVFELALLGEDASDEFTRLQNASVPPDYAALIAVVARHAREPAAIDHELRRLSTRDPLAAHVLIDAMAANHDVQGAAALARRSFEQLHDVSFLDVEVQFAFAAEDMAAVRRLLEEGLASGFLTGQQLLQYRVRLGEVLGADGEYRRALQQFELVLEQLEESWPVSALWNALVCAGKLEDWTHARELIDRFPRVPTTVLEISVWVNVHVLTGWSATAATTAMELATRFEGADPALAQHIAQSLLQHTRGEGPFEGDDEDDEEAVFKAPDLRPTVPGRVHAEAFALLARASSRADSGIELVREVDLQDDSLADRLRAASTNQHRDAVRRLGDEVLSGVLPLGLLAQTLREPYGLTLARRVLGVRLACSADGDIHASEVDAARAALNRAVVIDSSVLDLLPDLDGAADALTHFSRVLQPISARRDLAVSAVAARADTASVGRLGWDASDERPVLQHADPAQQIAVLERADRMLRLAQSVEVSSVEGAARVLDLDLGDEAAVWIDPVELAARLGAPLWSDDAAQRRLAAAVDVATFGTVNLQEALRLLPLNSAEVTAEEVTQISQEQEETVVELARNGIVEQPIALEAVLEDIDRNGGEPSLLSSALARPAWWARSQAFRDWSSVMRRVAESGGSVATFQEMAMTGAARRFHSVPAIAARVLALIAARGRESSTTASDIAEGFRAARRCATYRDIDEPAEHLAWAVYAVTRAEGAGIEAAELVRDVELLLEAEPQ